MSIVWMAGDLAWIRVIIIYMVRTEHIPDIF